MTYRETDEWRSEAALLEARLDKLEKKTQVTKLASSGFFTFVKEHRLGLVGLMLVLFGGVTGRMNELWFAIPAFVLSALAIISYAIMRDELHNKTLSRR